MKVIKDKPMMYPTVLLLLNFRAACPEERSDEGSLPDSYRDTFCNSIQLLG